MYRKEPVVMEPVAPVEMKALDGGDKPKPVVASGNQ